MKRARGVVFRLLARVGLAFGASGTASRAEKMSGGWVLRASCVRAHSFLSRHYDGRPTRRARQALMVMMMME